MKINVWIRRPQEHEGTYQFSGPMFITEAVNQKLRPIEIIAIYQDIQQLVKEKGGVDYFQVYENLSGDKLYFIDNCSPEMMAEESYKEKYNYCTLLFSHEY